MPTDTTPLLADDRRDSAADSDRLADSEDDALRGQAPSTQHGRSWHFRLREALLFAWALLATTGVLILAVLITHNNQTGPSKPSGKRNLIFMVSDGMGPASLSLTRSFRQYTEGLEYGDTLTLDKHFWGSSRTRSSSSLITDSAAGATAFSCGKKSYNGAISILPDRSPCGTVLEAAKKAGFMTGLVVTTDITDATPACFASHVDLRIQEDEIAMQEVGEGPLGRVVDLILGGGRCHFLPNNTQGGCRADSVNVVDIAKNKHGWNYVNDRAGFDDLWEGKKVKLPLLGLFADTDIPFELDRRNQNDVYPSLSEMARTAIKALEKATENSDKGFFLMIEGSRIDHAGHVNDPAAQVHEVLEYDKAFKSVIDFIKESKTEAVLVATSDHETGGLAVARQISPLYPEYLWYPSVLANASSSSIYLAHKLHEHLATKHRQAGESMEEFIKKLDPKHPATVFPLVETSSLKSYINNELVIPGLGISDATDKELDTIAGFPIGAQPLFAGMISVRAQIGWSTHGHSAVDVNIYSSGGPGTEVIRGNVENTRVGEFLREYIDVDVEAVTKELKKKLVKKTRTQEQEALLNSMASGGATLDHWIAHETGERERFEVGSESS